VQTGDRVADFELDADDGSRWKLSTELRKGPVVLFFYPRALTPGCTAESVHFRDLAAEFAGFGAQRVGISTDPVERQQKFRRKNGLDFPLLSDPDRTVARAFGARRPGPLFNRRATFVISQDRRLLAEIKSELATDRHADEALGVLRALAPQAGGAG
jgi:thioredoxin-dependent peroxiredoxin